MNKRMKIQLETEGGSQNDESGTADGGGLRAFRRQLFVSAAFAFMLALAIFVLASGSNDWAIVASMGLGLVACSVLVLALAV
jgi:hypothetical protein